MKWLYLLPLLLAWFIPGLVWLQIEQLTFSGFDLFPVLGIAPWIFVLLGFLGRYLRQRILRIALLSGLSVILIIVLVSNNLATNPEVTTRFEASTGTILQSELILGPTIWFWVYLANLAVLAALYALGNLITTKSGDAVQARNDDLKSDSPRDIWDEQ